MLRKGQQQQNYAISKASTVILTRFNHNNSKYLCTHCICFISRMFSCHSKNYILMQYLPQAKRKCTLFVAEYGEGWGGNNWISSVFLRLQQLCFLHPEASKLYYVLLQWIHKWAQQNDKSKYHSCTNATAKQDEKLFDRQNTIDGAYKKRKREA